MAQATVKLETCRADSFSMNWFAYDQEKAAVLSGNLTRDRLAPWTGTKVRDLEIDLA